MVSNSRPSEDVSACTTARAAAGSRAPKRVAAAVVAAPGSAADTGTTSPAESGERITGAADIAADIAAEHVQVEVEDVESAAFAGDDEQESEPLRHARKDAEMTASADSVRRI